MILTEDLTDRFTIAYEELLSCLRVADVQQLRLVVTDEGDNYYNDTANWAAARLLKLVPR